MLDKTRSFKYTYYTRQSKEALELNINGFRFKIQKAKEKSTKELYEKQVKAYQLLQKKVGQDFKEETIKYRGQVKISFRGKMFILMDEKTGSCAEHTIGWLQSLFDVVKIGTNTKGNAHFGFMGRAVLPKSNLKVLLGTHYYPTVYGLIERVGITPDIRVKNGEDALNIAFREIDKIYE